MAYDKVIDSAALEADLTTVADAIRTKGGTSEALSFPNGFVSAVANLSSGSGGTLTVTAPAGVTATVSKDDETKTKVVGSDGLAVFEGLESGAWTLTITDGVQTATQNVEITTDYGVAISFNVIPEFTYTGDFEIVNDSDEPITVSQDNWKIRLLTSGTLTFADLRSAEDGIDVFCVGGGGGGTGSGGGGGFTKTSKDVTVNTNEPYEINIGAGGEAGATGGTTSAFDLAADGGSGGAQTKGGSGGSGGGSYGSNPNPGSDGGSDGSNGGGTYGGTGQGTTTREFEEENASLYAGGGGGGTYTTGGAGGAGGGGAGGKDSSTSEPGETNTGGGGGGLSSYSGCPGGSGIVIIRNARG